MSTTSVRLLAETNFAWCDDKYLHVWDGVQKLSAADPRMGVVIELGDVPAAIAAKKAHAYARRFKLQLMCKTHTEGRVRQLSIRRRPDLLIGNLRSKVDPKRFKEARAAMGYSSTCSDSCHGKCRGFRNVQHVGRLDCHCPCHFKGAR